jgi:hypothetical protein
MAFTLPTFNVSVEIYTFASYVAPRLTVMANMSPGRRIMLEGPTPLMMLLLPALTDIRDGVSAGLVPDFVVAPAGSGRWYDVSWFDDVAKGFANEYRIAWISKHVNPATGAGWPQPAP